MDNEHLALWRGPCSTQREARELISGPKLCYNGPIIVFEQDTGCGSMDWIELAEDTGQMAGTCECGNESSGSIKCEEFNI